jgi:NAD(P)-dependent dehydrogenase (short-subunit alcohol dehydrogenase family)
MNRILITGAGRGIGRAIALELAGPDRHLFIHGRDISAIGETCRLVKEKGATTMPVIADLASAAGIDKIVAAIGGGALNLLVNNAGTTAVEPVEMLKYEAWQKMLAVNVTAPFLLCQKLSPRMPAGADIVNIMSIAARTGFAGWSGYCASKFALEGFSQAVRLELRPRGIRVITIYPGATDTELWNTIAGDWPRDRMLSPEEVARAVVYAVNRPDRVLVEAITVSDIGGAL